LLVIAALVSCAAIVFIACGAGEVLNLTDIEREVDTASNSGLQTSIGDGTIYSGYEAPSSSSEPPPPPPPGPGGSSSSTYTPPPSGNSSAGGSTQSSGSSGNSSAGGSTQSSSSRGSTGGNSSVSQAPGGCGEAAKPSQLTSCKWSNMEPLPGDKISAQIEGCTVIKTYYKDGTGFAPCLDLSGSITAGDGREYSLYADVDCGSGTTSITCNSVAKTKKAPTLDGTCTWSKNPTSAATGAKPSGVTLNDPSHVCGATADGKDAVYKNGSTTWPTDGMVDAGTYSNVKATYDCGSYSIEPKSCPELVVNAVEANMISCDGGWAATNCGNILGKDLELGDCLGVEVINIPAGDQYNKPTHNFNMICSVKTHTANNDDKEVSFTMTYNTTDYPSKGEYHAPEIKKSVGTSIPDASYHYPDMTGKKVCFKAAHNATVVTCRLDYVRE